MIIRLSAAVAAICMLSGAAFAQTKPLISHYTAAGLLRVVDADADVNTVFTNIQKAIGPARLPS